MERLIDAFSLTRDYHISRIIKGGWQLSVGHNTKISDDPVTDMFKFVESGIHTFDCADIYTGVETLIGRFVLANRERLHPYPVKIHTKYVPDLNCNFLSFL